MFVDEKNGVSQVLEKKLVAWEDFKWADDELLNQGLLRDFRKFKVILTIHPRFRLSFAAKVKAVRAVMYLNNQSILIKLRFKLATYQPLIRQLNTNLTLH